MRVDRSDQTGPRHGRFAQCAHTHTHTHLLIWLRVSWGIQLMSTSLWLDVPISTLAVGRLLCVKTDKHTHRKWPNSAGSNPIHLTTYCKTSSIYTRALHFLLHPPPSLNLYFLFLWYWHNQAGCLKKDETSNSLNKTSCLGCQFDHETLNAVVQAGIILKLHEKLLCEQLISLRFWQAAFSDPVYLVVPPKNAGTLSDPSLDVTVLSLQQQNSSTHTMLSMLHYLFV